MRKLPVIVLFLFALRLSAQQARIYGRVIDARGNGLDLVQIVADSLHGTVTDSLGHYDLEVPPGNYGLLFLRMGYARRLINLRIGAGQSRRVDVTLTPSARTLPTVEITGNTRKEREGAVRLVLPDIRIVPAPVSSVKNILISLPSVSQLDEMSSQYLVRGGNYDENAVYINGIEVFRPFLVRSGREEGLSIVNPDLIRSLYFYAGGFPTELGDKLSSVLDIQYLEPRRREHHVEASFTGLQWSALMPGAQVNFVGSLRYLNNTLLVRKTEGDAELRPAFLDAQGLLRWYPARRWKIEWLGRVALNRFRFVPFTKVTNFGTFTDARSLVIRYNGQEKDAFDSQFTAVKTQWDAGPRSRWQWINSLYHSTETEAFDLLASYFIGEPNTDLSGSDYGDPMNLQSLGQELDHARNDLDAVIFQSVLQWQTARKNHRWNAGLQFRTDNIRDRIREYQIVDSAGFSVLPPRSGFHPDEPYTSDTIPILPFQSARADYLSLRQSVGGYLSYRSHGHTGAWRWRLTAGIRTQFWTLTERFTGQRSKGVTYGPRFNLYVTRSDLPGHRFRLSAGLYMQPPGYREYRDLQGHFVPGILPQKAVNLSLFHRWDFSWADKPMRLSSEVYYRYLWDVNPYTVENLRIRYYARNNAVAYAYGLETRLFARLLPGTDSWLSLAFMRTEQNIDGRGYIPRPTDQRFKMALLFQDYVPGMAFLKMYLNNVFFTGLPTGAPLYADPYRFRFRTRNYWRTDIGLYYVLTDRRHPPAWARKFHEWALGLEIINMFDRRNSVSNLWVREIYTKRMFGVPNYMTGRIFNLKLKMRF